VNRSSTSSEYSLDELIEDGLVTLGRGKVISKKDLAATPGPYPVYSSARMNDGKFGEYGLYMFDEELITWSVDGGGRLFHRPRHKFSVTNVGGTLRINNTDRLSYRFLYHYLTLEHSRVRFDWVKKAHPSIIRKIYEGIPLIGMPEQERIVAILDEAFEAIDTAIANTEKNLSNTEELFQSILEQQFNNLDSGDSEWQQTALGEVSETIKRGISPKYVETGGIAVINQKCIRDHAINMDLSRRHNLSEKKVNPERYVKVGDVLVNSTGMGTLGRVAQVREEPLEPTTVDTHVTIVRPEPGRFVDAFFGWMLVHVENEITNSGAGASGQTELARSTLANAIKVSFPIDHQAQKLVVSVLDEANDSVQGLRDGLTLKLAGLEELKQSVLEKAFSGELTDSVLEEAGV
jgi:restriction endonuclease S subunit